MEEKYIDLLLQRCLNFDNSKILFINYDVVNKGFVDKVIKRAKELGVEEIVLDEQVGKYDYVKITCLFIETLYHF